MPDLDSFASRLADRLLADLQAQELSHLDLAAVRRTALRLIIALDKSFSLGPERRRDYRRIVDLAIAEAIARTPPNGTSLKH